MKRRLLINTLALATILGGITLTGRAGAQVVAQDPVLIGGGEGCTYSVCMQYCTKERGFDSCHSTCNRDCAS